MTVQNMTTFQTRYCHSVNEAGSSDCPYGKKIKFTSYIMLYTINFRSIKGIKWKFILVRIYRRMSLWCQDRIGCFKAQTMIEEIGRFDNLQILKLLTTTNNQKTPQLKRKIMRGQEWRYLQCI